MQRGLRQWREALGCQDGDPDTKRDPFDRQIERGRRRQRQKSRTRHRAPVKASTRRLGARADSMPVKAKDALVR